MASDQLSRKENNTTEREIYIEKQRVVPKMATHFESLADKATDSHAHAHADAAVASAKQTPQGQGRTGNVVAHGSRSGDDQKASRQLARPELESHAGKAGDNITAVRMVETEANRARKGREHAVHDHQGRMTRGPIVIGKFEDQEGGGGSIQSSKDKNQSGAKLSREEIGNLRASAQQNSTEAIRAAEERYSKARESANRGLNTTGAGSAEHAKEFKASQAKESASAGGEKGSPQAKEISGLQSTQQATEQGPQTKENVVQSAQNAALQAKETILENKDVASEKIQSGYASTKDTITSAGKTAVDYAAPAAGKAKDYAVKAAVTTKDVTIEKGKVAAEVAGKVAVDVKDKAIAAGWTAAHFTTEKALDATMVAAGVVGGVAEYAGHKALDITAAAGETVKEYTARKKEEAARELEAKRSATDSDRANREVNQVILMFSTAKLYM